MILKETIMEKIAKELVKIAKSLLVAGLEDNWRDFFGFDAEFLFKKLKRQANKTLKDFDLKVKYKGPFYGSNGNLLKGKIYWESRGEPLQLIETMGDTNPRDYNSFEISYHPEKDTVYFGTGSKVLALWENPPLDNPNRLSDGINKQVEKYFKERYQKILDAQKRMDDLERGGGLDNGYTISYKYVEDLTDGHDIDDKTKYRTLQDAAKAVKKMEHGKRDFDLRQGLWGKWFYINGKKSSSKFYETTIYRNDGEPFDQRESEYLEKELGNAAQRVF